MDSIGLVLAFLGGLLAPAVGNALNAFVSSKIGRSERSRDRVDARSVQAAEACYEELSRLAQLIPRFANADRRTGRSDATEADYERSRQLRAEHDPSIAILEANTVLLRREVRDEMDYVLGILRHAYDLPYRTTPHGPMDVGWHPDGASQIARELTRYGRAVLASQIANTSLPRRSDAVIEYELAVVDRSDDFEDHYAEYIQDDDQAVEKWRTKHGLPPKRGQADT